ncbi:hypothetical protein [Legionella sp. 227]|uniref:hypothetical protein n=1 Tax=Legionella sp. 227 TaxID=3367288 RepID=UPI00370D2FE6
MSGSKEETNKSITSDQLHNRNCFNYLRNVKFPDLILDKLPADLAKDLKSLRGKEKKDYDPNFPYGDLYTKFFDYLDEHIKTIYDAPRSALGNALEQIKNYQNLPKKENDKLQQSIRFFVKQLGVLDYIKNSHTALHLLSELPKDPTKYKGSYIYCNNSGGKRLYYISPDGTRNELSIDERKFNENLAKINEQQITPFLLKEDQVTTLITDNLRDQNADLHVLPELPDDLTTYIGSYIYCEDSKNNNENKKLYHIEADGTCKIININDFEQFDLNLKEINKQNRKLLHLNNDEVTQLITTNVCKKTLEQKLDLKVERLGKEIEVLEDFIFSLYANDNDILEDTYKEIEHITLGHTPNSPGIQKSIARHVSDKGESINSETQSPAEQESTTSKVSALYADVYKPQHGTSLATIRRYRSNLSFTEYRFGTQGQRHHGEARVSPLFERFLAIEENREQARIEQIKKERSEKKLKQEDQVKLDQPALIQAEVDQALLQKEEPADEDEDIDEDRITHIYFNVLGRDIVPGIKESIAHERAKEGALTEQLEKLEFDPINNPAGHKNVAVITLPADKGLMSHEHYASTQAKHNIVDVKEEFLRIAREGRDLHLMDQLPVDRTQYKGSYIYTDSGNDKKLFYIKLNGEEEAVNIKDFSIFEKIKERKLESPVLLDDYRVKTWITENGGHTPPLTKVKDFHISKRVREKVFRNEDGKYTPETETKIINDLLDRSFKALGYSQDTVLSDAQRQAVWFHFLKYELTNHIIESLNPKSINFTCKDAIDRGGVASAYFNLMKSFEKTTEKEAKAGIMKVPMSREEFEQALHAAPTMVKGRGMNHHIDLIWNAIDAYVNEHYDQLINNKDQAWLIEWRDYNCPHERVDALLEKRLGECKTELSTHQDKLLQDLQTKLQELETELQESLEEPQKEPTLEAPQKKPTLEELQNKIDELQKKLQARQEEPELDELQAKLNKLQEQTKTISKKLDALSKGVDVLNEVDKQKQCSGKRLLLETTLRTTSMAISPETQSIKSCQQYKKLHDELSINFPDLKILRGAMKIFAGTIIDAVLSAVSKISGGKVNVKSDLTSRGWATFNAGQEHKARKTLQEQMRGHMFKIRLEKEAPVQDTSDAPADKTCH